MLLPTLATFSSSTSAFSPPDRASVAQPKLAVRFDDGCHYELLVGGRSWLKSGGLRLYANSEWHSAPTAETSAAAPFQVNGTIQQVAGPTNTAGTDRFGEYERVSFEWLATSSSGATAKFGTGARSYKDGATVVFEQSIADGANRTAYKEVDFSDGGNGQKAKVEPQPFLHFPSFDMPSSELFAEAGRAGFVTWMGTMVNMHGPKAGPPTADDLGLSSGPVVLFDGFENGGNNDAVVVSPATHFKGATMNVWADEWVVGLSGEITEVPRGFAHETIVHASKGVTATVAGFGALMQAAHGTRKKPDVIVERIGYWTDNGAYYYGDAYPQHHDVPGNVSADYNLSCCTEAKLLAAKRALDADAIPMSYMQLDDCAPRQSRLKHA